MEVGLIIICAAVHFFAPYNMAEGRSRYRYTMAYSIEATEIVVSLHMQIITYNSTMYLIFKTIISCQCIEIFACVDSQFAQKYLVFCFHIFR